MVETISGSSEVNTPSLPGSTFERTPDTSPFQTTQEDTTRLSNAENPNQKPRNRGTLRKLITESPPAQFIGQNNWDNKAWVLERIEKEYKEHKDFANSPLPTHELATLSKVSPKLKNDEEVVLAAMKRNPYALQYADDSLKNNKEFMLRSIKVDAHLVRYASDKLKDDEEFMLVATETYNYLFDAASNRLKDREDFVRVVIKRSSLMYRDFIMKNASIRVQKLLEPEMPQLGLSSSIISETSSS